MDFFVRQMKRKAGHVANIPRTMSSLGKRQKTKSFRKKRKKIVRFKANYLPSIFYVNWEFFKKFSRVSREIHEFGIWFS